MLSPGVMPARRLLLGLAGLEIDGGIASVSRCIARVLDETANEAGIERADRVLLHDAADPPPAAPAHGEQFLAGGSQARFAWQLWRAVRRRRPDLVFFDQVGLARSALLPLPGLPPRYAVFCHGMVTTVYLKTIVGMTDVLERATEMQADGGLVTPAVGAPPPAPTR